MFDKAEYKELKRNAKEDGVMLFSAPNSGDNGFTVAAVPMIQGPECRMIAVSVSYCAVEDTFKKKYGKYEALKKLYGAEYVQLPLGEFLSVTDEESLENFLVNLFNV